MLKKSITYTNPFTDEEVTEVHHFHISKADLVEMEMEEHGNSYTKKDGEELTGMQAKLQRMVDSEDGKAIIAEFKDIIRRSYGRKEGDRFVKSAAVWEDFASSEAFSQLLFELCTNAGEAAEFINGVVPSNLSQIATEVAEEAEKARTAQPDEAAPQGDPTGLTTETTPRILTTAEMEAMDSDELKSGLATGRYKLS